MKFNVIALALCLSISVPAIAKTKVKDDGIKHQPLMTRTAQNYMNACALQYKLWGILGAGVIDNNDEYINIAISKMIEYNYPDDAITALYQKISSDKKTAQELAPMAPPDVKYQNNAQYKEMVDLCAYRPRQTLINYNTAFIGHG